MTARCSVLSACALALLACASPASAGHELLAGPAPAEAPAWELALWGLSPYADFEAAGLPLPPSPAEVAALSAPRRMQVQAVLKSIWLERLIRAREERNRVTRENLAACARMAAQLGAPEVFTDSFRRLSAGDLPARERYLLGDSQQRVLEAYGVDARELRYFVEASGLSPEQLREVVAWLPLPGLFDVAPGAQVLSPREVGEHYVALLAVRRDLAAVWKGVHDRESADAAAEALLPVLLRHLSAMRPLMAVPMEARAPELLAPYMRFAAPVNAACARERARLQEVGFYGSARLQALDYLLH